MKVGLYFGSFNPIHTGHCIIASYIANNSSLDQVWLVVSPHNPFKPSASLLNEYHRLHLVNLALEGETRIKSSDIEFYLPKPSYTVDTLAYLKEKHPGHEFAIIMGSDSYQNLPKWKNAGTIIRDHAIYIYKRPGFEIETLLDARHEILQAPLLEISSTQVRELVKQKKPIRYFVPDAVKDEIERNSYYRGYSTTS